MTTKDVPSFIRESTGLVREISTSQAFIFNLSASPLGPAIVYMMVGTTIFPGGDVILPGIIAIIMSFFIAAMHGQLTAAFPTSGGDYVFNSRILHPPVGFGMNFLYQLSGLGRRRIFGVPLVSVTGVVSALYLIFLTAIFFSIPQFGLANSLMVTASFGPIMLGILIYYFVGAYRKKQGFDLSMVFAAVPPE
jgi:amino acid transporter